MSDGNFCDYRHQRLAALAREYHERCEAYDRTVCASGTDALGIVHPVDHRQLARVGTHAMNVWHETMRQGKALGFTVAEVRHAITKAA